MEKYGSSNNEGAEKGVRNDRPEIVETPVPRLEEFIPNKQPGTDKRPGFPFWDDLDEKQIPNPQEKDTPKKPTIH